MQLEYPEKEDSCKGLYYKAVKNEFFNSKGEYVESIRMRPMSRMSCKGCEDCTYILEDAKLQLGMGYSLLWDDVRIGAYYELCVTDFSRDWETGVVDDWEVGFKIVEDNNV